MDSSTTGIADAPPQNRSANCSLRPPSEHRETIAPHGADGRERSALAAQKADLERRLAELEAREKALGSKLQEMEEESRKLKGTYDGLVATLKKELQAGQVQVKPLRDGLSVNLAQEILFDSGSAALDTSGQEIPTRLLAAWVTTTEDYVTNQVRSLVQTRDGRFLAGGQWASFPLMMLARIDETGQVSSCPHPVTQAVMPSGDGWTVEARNVIDPVTIAMTETDKPVMDTFQPDNQLRCTGSPTYTPSEVSPPAASENALLFEDERTVIWEAGAPGASASFDLYRGDVADLPAGGGPIAWPAASPRTPPWTGALHRPVPRSSMSSPNGTRRGPGLSATASASAMEMPP